MFFLNMLDYPMSSLPVHLDLEHLPNTQGYLGLLSEFIYFINLKFIVWWVTFQYQPKGLGPGLDNVVNKLKQVRFLIRKIHLEC